MRRSAVTGPLARLGVKALLMAVVLFAVVPASVAVTDMVDRTYEVSAQAQAAAEQGADDAGEQSQEEGDGSILDFITGIPEMLADGVSSLTDEVLDQVNRLIESLAVMIVTSCVIPVVVLLFFLWAANALLAWTCPAPSGPRGDACAAPPAPPAGRRRPPWSGVMEGLPGSPARGGWLPSLGYNKWFDRWPQIPRPGRTSREERAEKNGRPPCATRASRSTYQRASSTARSPTPCRTSSRTPA